MNDTITMSGPNDWLNFYQQSFPSSVSDATTVTTTATPTQLSPEGRISKPIRRRSRASRRTPTTLLNTDTTNFRAMVQQFTGGPSAGSGPAALPNLGFGFGFGLGSRAVHVNPSGLMLAPSLEQQQQAYEQQQQQHTYGEGGGDNTFFQRLIGNPTGTPSHLVDDGGRFFPNTST